MKHKLKIIVDAYEKSVLLECFKRNNLCKKDVAVELGLNMPTLHYKFKKHSIRKKDLQDEVISGMIPNVKRS